MASSDFSAQQCGLVCCASKLRVVEADVGRGDAACFQLVLQLRIVFPPSRVERYNIGQTDCDICFSATGAMLQEKIELY